ncbi:MAG: MFS transporter [Deltaproteobacteria bacterium]|nr:MFS transporter [Deltaproteobacteria bacterium]
MASNTAQNRAVVWTIAFTNFATPFMFSGVGVTLPSMGRELSMSGAELGLFETLYLGTAAALVLPAGRMGDATDKNTLFTLGVALFAACTLGLGFLHSVPLLLILRVVQAAAIALVAATNMAILTETVPSERLGRAIGLSIGAVYTGLSAGPFVAGMITTGLGWRWVYTLSALVSCGAAVASWRCLERRWRRPKQAFDWAGTVLSALGLMLLIGGSASAAESTYGRIALGGAVACLLAFVVIERRAASPLVPLDLLTTNLVLLRALTVQLLTYAGAVGTSFLFSLYLQEARGWTAQEAGRILMVSPVLMALLAPPSGRLADRIRPQLLATVGVALIVGGTVAAWMVPATGSLTLLVVALVGHGTGFALFSSPNMAVIMRSTPRERTGMASALAAQMRTLGMVTSMMLITVFLSIHVGEAGLGPDSVPGLLTAMRWALGCIGVLALWALVTALRDLWGQREQAAGQTPS